MKKLVLGMVMSLTLAGATAPSASAAPPETTTVGGKSGMWASYMTPEMVSGVYAKSR